MFTVLYCCWGCDRVWSERRGVKGRGKLSAELWWRRHITGDIWRALSTLHARHHPVEPVDQRIVSCSISPESLTWLHNDNMCIVGLLYTSLHSSFKAHFLDQKLISCVNTRLVLVVLLAGATSSKKHKALSTLAIIVADFGDVIFYRIRRQSPKNRRRRQIVTENGDSRRIDCRQIRRL